MGYCRTYKIILSFLSYVIICSLLFSACSFKLKVKKIKYDEANGFYSYPYQGANLPLRNKNFELIDKSNFDSFLISLDTSKMYFDIKRIKENDLLILSEDADLVNLYSGIISSLSVKEFSAANFFC